VPNWKLEITDQFTPQNAHFARAVLTALQHAHEGMGDEFLSVRYRDLVPVREGTLRGSAYAQTDRYGQLIATRLGYGTPYAARQHERTEYAHPKGGQAKYVFGAPNAPLDENLDRWQQSQLRAVMKAWPGAA
jgi:hypothetical protein